MNKKGAEMKIVVTGSTGYIGKHVVRAALARGFEVTATLRDLNRSDEVRRAVGAGSLAFHQVDLLSDQGWDDVMQGKDAVLHTASPVPVRAVRDADAVLRPAIEGTMRVIDAALKAQVPRIVLTSSIAAVYGGVPKAGLYTSQDWTDPDAAGVGLYAKSKTRAEHMAWQAMKGQNSSLITINPAFVFGAPLDPFYASSVMLAERLYHGKDLMLPRISFASVDVRDVAEAHIAAALLPQGGQRIIASGPTYWMRDLARAAREVPGARTAKWTAPDSLVRFLARFEPLLQEITSDLGIWKEFETQGLEQLLGKTLRNPLEAFRETVSYVASNPRQRAG